MICLEIKDVNTSLRVNNHLHWNVFNFQHMKAVRAMMHIMSRESKQTFVLRRVIVRLFKLSSILPVLLRFVGLLATDPSKMTGLATTSAGFVKGRTLDILRTVPLVSTTITNTFLPIIVFTLRRITPWLLKISISFDGIEVSG